MKESITIHDVGKKAQVSPSTVSRVINNTTRVSPKRRDQVLRAITELGYKTNIAARTLKTNKSLSIVCVVPEYSNPYFTEIYRGIQTEMNTNGYVTFLYEGTDAKNVINNMIMRGVDGVIFDAIYRKVMKTALTEAGIPFVQINTPAQYSGQNCIRIDIFNATLKIIDYLRLMGHTKIGLITYKANNFPIREKFRAFKYYAETKNIANYRDCISEQEFSSVKATQGYAAMKDFINRGIDLTAIIALNDFVALGAISAAIEYGLKVPHDISIIGFDNSEVAQHSNPPLTTVNIPTFKQGEIAAQMLIELMNSERAEPYSVELHTELIIRKSVKNLVAKQ